MNSQKYVYLLVVLLGASGGYYLGRATARPETVTVTEQQKDKIITIVRTVKSPNGTITRDRTTTEDRIVERNLIEIKPLPKPNWRISGGYSGGFALVPAYQLSIERRILGPVFLGANADTAGRFGVTAGFEF